MQGKNSFKEIILRIKDLVRASREENSQQNIDMEKEIVQVQKVRESQTITLPNVETLIKCIEYNRIDNTFSLNVQIDAQLLSSNKQLEKKHQQASNSTEEVSYIPTKYQLVAIDKYLSLIQTSSSVPVISSQKLLTTLENKNSKMLQFYDDYKLIGDNKDLLIDYSKKFDEYQQIINLYSETATNIKKKISDLQREGKNEYYSIIIPIAKKVVQVHEEFIRKYENILDNKVIGTVSILLEKLDKEGVIQKDHNITEGSLFVKEHQEYCDNFIENAEKLTMEFESKIPEKVSDFTIPDYLLNARYSEGDMYDILKEAGKKIAHHVLKVFIVVVIIRERDCQRQYQMKKKINKIINLCLWKN
ncbi:MAG: hypothetical protein P857_1031 [Candidatus Xenolissoclinum pacificiensis L6]|uniref:Uncharacterized protein n=1 Tax=Candidatus Xenolissoclinum pacificiensis L6 TaxID=1401685 RepID=W2V322_9RICK|nr:MAG: hypothetical protein P857_1031 [Candidatus Xenolissoclinum pacificiensis L6]